MEVMRNVLIAMVCIVMAAALFGCIRQELAAAPQPTFIDDGNGAYVAAVRKECTMSIYDALVKDPELAKQLTMQDLQDAMAQCLVEQGVRSI